MNIVILYTIKFNKGKYDGKTVQLEIDLEDIEIDDLAGFLVNNGFLECYVNDNEFEVINRQVV